MWHRVFSILFFACAWAWVPGPALAEDTAAAEAAAALSAAPGQDNVFTAQGLALDVTAESAVAARKLALLDGQRRALDLVLRRITLRSDHGALPKPDDETIAQLVATVQVSGEKTSSVRYLAALTVRFHRAAIRNLLRGAGFSFSETRAKATLVLPVFEKGAALSLFEDSNIWRRAWERLDLPPDSLLPLLLPKGDLKDITAVAAKAAVAGSEEQLRTIARRYGVDNVTVSHAILSIDLAAGGVPQVQVNMLHFSPRGKSTEVMDYGVEVGEDLDTAMDRLAQRVAVDQLERWKRRTRLTFDADTSLSAQVPLSGLADWLLIRQRLNASAMVGSIKLQGISREDAQVVIDYLGDTDSLVVSLAQRDLHLSLIDGFWVLRLARQGTVKAE
ncbi:MAG: DUF2066 domain-containing protein [Proteobacteria bacterium]|nr:DUF2066 domain-containing protein [Pseudomonadota bacterium]